MGITDSLKIRRNRRVESYVSARLAALVDMYEKSQARLTTILSKVNLTKFEKWRTQELLVQVNQELRALNIKAVEWSKITAKGVYTRSAEFNSANLGMNPQQYLGFGNRIHVSAINVIADQMAIDLLSANNASRREFTRFIRQTQLQVATDQKILQTVGEGILEGQGHRKLGKRILADLQSQLVDGKHVVINGRRYNAKKYAELVGRTRTREATSRAALNVAVSTGNDLVQISVHDSDPDICLEFQGKIYSISGNDKRFPPLLAIPPFHPNCKHVMNAIVIDLVESRGHLDTMSEFSKGTTQAVDFDAMEDLLREGVA